MKKQYCQSKEKSLRIRKRFWKIKSQKIKIKSNENQKGNKVDTFNLIVVSIDDINKFWSSIQFGSMKKLVSGGIKIFLHKNLSLKIDKMHLFKFI